MKKQMKVTAELIQDFTEAEKERARNNIGAIGPLEVKYGNSTSFKSISWSTTNSGNGFNKVIGNLGLTKAGDYLVFFDAKITSSTNTGWLNILVNTGEGTGGRYYGNNVRVFLPLDPNSPNHREGSVSGCIYTTATNSADASTLCLAINNGLNAINESITIEIANWKILKVS